MNNQSDRRQNQPLKFFNYLAICTLIFVVLSGCDKEKMDELVAKAKDTASEIGEKSGDALKKVKESTDKALNNAKDSVTNIKDTAAKLTTSAGNLVSMNGSANITLDAPTDFPASFVRIVSMPDGTKVLQMKSYKDGESDAYPAFFIQAVVEQSSVDSLSGQSIPCQLFAQTSEGGDVWTNANGQPIAVQFTKQDKKLMASFSGGVIQNVASGSEATSSGTFDCVTLE
jgi:hypothetical protein